MKIIAVEVRTEFSLFSAARVGYRTQGMGRERLRNSAGDGPEYLKNPQTIMPAPTVLLFASSIKINEPVARCAHSCR